MRLDDWLTRRGMTTRALAQTLRVSLQAAQKWRQGTRIPRPETARKIHKLTKGQVSYKDWYA